MSRVFEGVETCHLDVFCSVLKVGKAPFKMNGLEETPVVAMFHRHHKTYISVEFVGLELRRTWRYCRGLNNLTRVLGCSIVLQL